MNSTQFKKMAGTAAVFVFADKDKASPVERDGMIWNAEELHLSELNNERREMPAMANALSLEGLEDYDPANDGDTRRVESLDTRFIYLQRTHSWIEIQ